MRSMRKLIVLVGLMLIADPATAQTTLGLRGGVGFATVSIEEAGVEEESVSRTSSRRSTDHGRGRRFRG